VALASLTTAIILRPRQYERRRYGVCSGCPFVPPPPGILITKSCKEMRDTSLDSLWSFSVRDYVSVRQIVPLSPLGINNCKLQRHAWIIIHLPLASEIVQGGARSIIVKFVSYQTRNDIWKAKRNLKGTKILVTESLTPARQALLKEVKERLDPARSGQRMEKSWQR
jgi:hypothetical protein